MPEMGCDLKSDSVNGRYFDTLDGTRKFIRVT
jgi:hypothetical protein